MDDETPAQAIDTLRINGIDLEESGEASADLEREATLAADAAVQRAREEFGLREVGKVVSAALGRVTTPGYGREGEPDPERPSQIDPMRSDRPVWTVTIANVPAQKNGPMGQRERATEAELSTMVVLLDSSTGEFLYALTY